MSAQFPTCPASLKAIQHYLKTASEHDQRDPVVSYWCRLYALQLGLKIDKSSTEAKMILTSLMDWLETQKKVMGDNEAVTNEVAGQAHIENYALKLFLFADSQDRAGNFGKNVVKAFYTAGMLFDVLGTFGELSEEVVQNRKYAKWKAAYIHNCLKNGETPISGPMPEEGMGGETGEFDDEGAGYSGGARASGSMGFVQPPQGFPAGSGGQQPSPQNFPTTPTFSDVPPSGPNPYIPVTPTDNTPRKDSSLGGFQSYNPGAATDGTVHGGGGLLLNPEQVGKAQKYCKWAGSALNYDDVPTAISNLQKALKLLQTGQDD